MLSIEILVSKNENVADVPEMRRKVDGAIEISHKSRRK